MAKRRCEGGARGTPPALTIHFEGKATGERAEWDIYLRGMNGEMRRQVQIDDI